MPFKDNPCLCIKLRWGIFTIAIWDIAIGILGALAAVYGIVLVSQKSQESSQPPDHTNVSLTTTTEVTPTTSNSTIDSTIATASDVTNHGAWLCAVLAMFIVYCIFQAVFGGVLILAVTREKLLLYKAWLVFRVSGVMFTLGTFISFMLLREQATFQPSILDAIGVIFSSYCIYVVYVQAQELKRQQTTTVKPFKS